MKPTYRVLEMRNKALRKRISDLEKLNREQFERLHKSEERIQWLESENAYLRERGN